MDRLLSLFHQNSAMLYKLIFLILLAFSIKIIITFLKAFLKLVIVKTQIRYRIVEYLNLISWILFFIVAIFLFKNAIGEFAIPVSVFAAGIAFALQEVIASIAGRIVIILSNLYQVGDRIQINEMQGDVIAIGFLRTSLMEIGNWVKADQHSGRVVHIANSALLKSDLINYSANFPFVWDEIVIPVRYGSDQHLARKIILEITDNITQEFQQKATEAWKQVQARYMIEQSSFHSVVTLIANDNWLEFTARYIVPCDKRRIIKDKLCSAYVDAFADTNKRVEYGSTTIEITSFPAVKIATKE